VTQHKDGSSSSSSAIGSSWIPAPPPPQAAQERHGLTVQAAADVKGAFATAAAAATSKAWPLIGVDAYDPQVDDDMLSPSPNATSQSFLSSAPHAGSVSGTGRSFGGRGETSETSHPDVSHLGLRYSQLCAGGGGLVPLPRAYVDLYTMCKNPEGSMTSVRDPAICLICGQVVHASNRLENDTPRTGMEKLSPGECTLHAAECSGGVGCFYVVQSYRTIICHGGNASYDLPLYVDRLGGSERGPLGMKPLFLSEARYRALEKMYRKHQIIAKVGRDREASRRVVRRNFY